MLSEREMDFLRKIVSGPKNRFKEDGYNLDLTYVCTRLIAMSYPASGVESVYRNPIDKVRKDDIKELNNSLGMVSGDEIHQRTTFK